MCSKPPNVFYRPSVWELEWSTRHAFDVQYDRSRNWTRGCALMVNKTASIDAWLAFARLRRPTFDQEEPPALSAEARETLSFLEKIDHTHFYKTDRYATHKFNKTSYIVQKPIFY